MGRGIVLGDDDRRGGIDGSRLISIPAIATI